MRSFSQLEAQAAPILTPREEHRIPTKWTSYFLSAALDVLFNVLGNRDSLSVKAAGFPRIENSSLDSLDLALKVASDRLGNGLVRSGLDLSLASALIADSDVPNLALSS